MVKPPLMFSILLVGLIILLFSLIPFLRPILNWNPDPRLSGAASVLGLVLGALALVVTVAGVTFKRPLIRYTNRILNWCRRFNRRRTTARALNPLLMQLMALDEGHDQHCESVRALVAPWLSLLGKSSDGNIRKLLAALFRRYAIEENRLIGDGSHSGRHCIVTSFVAYSAFVEALISEALTLFPQHIVVCHTTLAMPLAKWFNFTARSGHKKLPYRQAHDGWTAYTSALRRLLHENKGSLIIKRCVLSAEECEYQTATLPGFAILSENTRRDEMNAHIVCPIESPHLLGPLEKLEIESLFAVDSVGPLIESLYKGVPRAHIILPAAEQPPPFNDSSKWCWQPLGKMFISLFHSAPTLENSLFRVLRSQDISDHWDGDETGMPEDVFMLGIEPRVGGSLTWLVCLAGDVSAEGDRVSIELIVDAINQRRFAQVVSYVNWLFGDGATVLNNLIKNR